MNTKVLRTLEFYKMIDALEGFASTSLGKSAVRRLLPSGRLDEVKRRLQATDEAVRIERLKGPAPFGGVVDIGPSLKRARIGSVLGPQELLDIAQTLYGGRRLQRFVAQVHEDEPTPLLAKLCERMTEHKELEDAIKACIDESADILDRASPELARIRGELRTGESRVRDRLEQMIRTPSIQKMLQDNLITIRSDRYVIPVKQEYRASFGGIVHDQSASGATLFIEPESIVTMNNRLRELRLAEEREIEKILQRLSALVAEVSDTAAANVEVLAELDFIFAKAGFAHEQKATLPIMNDRGFLKLKRGRHPLLPRDRVVPLDVELGNKFSMIIVTGPNTGGKTVTLKTIGLISLMAMAGLFVPVEDGSQLCVFDAIYADIGDEQSIEQNLSTFSSHMTNIISMIGSLSPKSLVLLDEVGAGTDPAEGSALAISILEHIHALGCRVVATTHYSELKAYAYDRKGTINASMEFDVQSLSPTYRLLVGVPGRSNAFAIAERLGLPAQIIEHARSQVGEEDQRVESMIATLEENRLSAESERQTAEQQRQESERLRRELEEQQRRFEEQRDKLFAKAEQEAREAVAKARREADEVLAELRRLAQEERGAVKEHQLIEARRRLEEAASSLRKPSAPAAGTAAKKPLGPGDEVVVRSLGSRGHIVELAGDNEVVVQLGIMKMKVAKTEVELFKSAANAGKPSPPPKPQVKASVKRTRDDDIRTELDLRGANLEESYIEVDRFLDESLMSNLSQVYIIHGKGTGVLRTGIQEFLRKNRHVKSFRLGNYGEGGSGVTVVELE